MASDRVVYTARYGERELLTDALVVKSLSTFVRRLDERLGGRVRLGDLLWEIAETLSIASQLVPPGVVGPAIVPAAEEAIRRAVEERSGWTQLAPSTVARAAMHALELEPIAMTPYNSPAWNGLDDLNDDRKDRRVENLAALTGGNWREAFGATERGEHDASGTMAVVMALCTARLLRTAQMSWPDLWPGQTAGDGGGKHVPTPLELERVGLRLSAQRSPALREPRPLLFKVLRHLPHLSFGGGSANRLRAQALAWSRRVVAEVGRADFDPGLSGPAVADGAVAEQATHALVLLDEAIARVPQPSPALTGYEEARTALADLIGEPHHRGHQRRLASALADMVNGDPYAGGDVAEATVSAIAPFVAAARAQVQVSWASHQAAPQVDAKRISMPPTLGE